MIVTFQTYPTLSSPIPTCSEMVHFQSWATCCLLFTVDAIEQSESTQPSNKVFKLNQEAFPSTFALD